MSVAVVVGANGFLGSQVAAAISAVAGGAVVGAGLGPAPRRFLGEWLDLDLLADGPGLATELDRLRPEWVVNCAGVTAGSARALFRGNVLTTIAILDALDAAALQARLVHLGSAAEYGTGPAGEPVAEARCANPMSPYGISKLAATQLVVAWGARGRQATVLRVFNPLGPEMTTDSLPGAALAKLRHAVAHGSPFVEMGPLDAVRDFVDVRDEAPAAAAACHHDSPAGSIVNVASGVGHTTRELVEALAQRLGFAGEIREQAAGSSRSSYVPWQIADVSLAAETLHWRPAHDLASSVDWMVVSTAEP